MTPTQRAIEMLKGSTGAWMTVTYIHGDEVDWDALAEHAVILSGGEQAFVGLAYRIALDDVSAEHIARVRERVDSRHNVLIDAALTEVEV